MAYKKCKWPLVGEGGDILLSFFSVHLFYFIIFYQNKQNRWLEVEIKDTSREASIVYDVFNNSGRKFIKPALRVFRIFLKPYIL